MNTPFTLESNWQSAKWTAAGENRLKWPKMQTSAGKVLASKMWDVQSILFIDYLEKGRTINSEYYIELLVHLNEEIKKKKNGHKWRRKSAFTPKQCTVSQVDCNDDKTMLIALWSASAPTLFSRSGCLQTSKECYRERDLTSMKT